MRVTLLDEGPISSSLPASCLAEHLNEEQWTLTIDEAGHLVSLQLTVPDGICSPHKALENVQNMPEGHLTKSVDRPITLKAPREAPAVVHTPQGDQQAAGGPQPALAWEGNSISQDKDIVSHASEACLVVNLRVWASSRARQSQLCIPATRLSSLRGRMLNLAQVADSPEAEGIPLTCRPFL